MTDDYEILSDMGADKLRVRFDGQFAGNAVLWDATIVTLNRYVNEKLGGGGKSTAIRPFLQVSAYEQTSAVVPIEIGLPVLRIDRPTILKTIIMVRQYKRLTIGRHEFGQAWSQP